MYLISRYLLALTVGIGIFTLAAARLAHLDPLTIHLPHPARSVIATLALHEKRGPYAIDRALTLDPDNAAAWEQRCVSTDGPTPIDRLDDCRKAVSLRASSADQHSEGEAFEENNDPCNAAQAFRNSAAKLDAPGQKPYYLRDAARAALACGDDQSSLAALHEAEALDTQVLDEAGPANNAGREGLSLDRGYMSVVYDHMNQHAKANMLCTAANPGYASCTCQLSGSWLRCNQAAPPAEVASR